MYGKIKQENYAIIPLELFLCRGWAKLEIALAKGKKLYDKRETMKKKEAYVIPPRENRMETLAFFNLKKKKKTKIYLSINL